MKKALITTKYPVTVIPTQMRFGLTRDMFELEGQKLCEISYEILADKYLKTVEVPDEVGNRTEEIEVDFATPVLYHSDRKIIPYSMYLLIEQYRISNEPELLQQINTALGSFQFEGSLSGFSLQVSDIA